MKTEIQAVPTEVKAVHHPGPEAWHDLRMPNKTKKDVARFLGVTVRTVENLMAHSTLPFYRLGSRRVRFRYQDVMAWMNEHHRVGWGGNFEDPVLDR